MPQRGFQIGTCPLEDSVCLHFDGAATLIDPSLMILLILAAAIGLSL